MEIVLICPNFKDFVPSKNVFSSIFYFLKTQNVILDFDEPLIASNTAKAALLYWSGLFQLDNYELSGLSYTVSP